MAHETRSVDVAVIGAGTAGLAAYRSAVANGARAVVIEAGSYGTTCARVGCMPSKLLIAAAEAAHTARDAGPFGVHASVTVDGKAVMDRVRRERDRFVGFVLDGVERIRDEDKIRGRARFVGPHTLEVADIAESDASLRPSTPARSFLAAPFSGRTDCVRIEARSIVIATGSSPVIPPMFEAVRDRLVINDDVFAWESLPSSVAVFGAGVIGLELGQSLHRLGVRVRVFGRGGAIGPLTDPAVRDATAAAIGAEIPIHPDAKVHAVRRVLEGVEVEFDRNGHRTSEVFDYVLVAAGRRPNINGLGLEHAGLALDARGMPRFDRTTLRCGESSIFIAGDVNDDVPLLHEAADEGRIAGENAAHYPKVTAVDRRSALGIAFTDPQIAMVGSSWRELAGREDVIAGEISFDDQGRSRVMRRNRGLCRLYAEVGTGRFLGAEMSGPSAEHIGHLLAWAHQQRLTIDQMLAMPFYHPVVEEGIRTALRDASAKLVAVRAQLRETTRRISVA